ncbi:Uncharacterised protein [Candidatus Norongarragalina meridionalis]|nr:Uncharacterised protein [Candidatus Norongarragalina meridionalis]
MKRIFTIGHSTRTLAEFAALLKENGVVQIADVRTVPRSRHVPQFNRETLPKSLEKYGVSYAHIPALGGLRKPEADSKNAGWRNASFRGYADYMQTPGFEAGLKTLVEMSRKRTTAIMCAEAVPWRCHRSLIADALLARGIPVLDIIGKGNAKPHGMTPFAETHGTRVTYPASLRTSSRLP